MLPRLLSALLALSLFASTASAAKRYRNHDVLVHTDVTFLGEQQAPVDPVLNPIYYQFLTRGFIQFDESVAGELAPEREALLQHIVAALRPLGYLPADGEHKPRIAFGVTWGSIFVPEYETVYMRNRMNSIEFVRDPNPRKSEQNNAQSAIEFLSSGLVPLMWRPNFDAWYNLAAIWPEASTGARDRIARICGDDVYALAITAYDYDNASAAREVFLWQTRALTPAPRMESDEAFHRMIDMIVPLLGQATPYPDRHVARRDTAEAALQFGFENADEIPPPVDLAAVTAFDFSQPGGQ